MGSASRFTACDPADRQLPRRQRVRFHPGRGARLRSCGRHRRPGRVFDEPALQERAHLRQSGRVRRAEVLRALRRGQSGRMHDGRDPMPPRSATKRFGICTDSVPCDPLNDMCPTGQRLCGGRRRETAPSANARANVPRGGDCSTVSCQRGNVCVNIAGTGGATCYQPCGSQSACSNGSCSNNLDGFQLRRVPLAPHPSYRSNSDALGHPAPQFSGSPGLPQERYSSCNGSGRRLPACVMGPGESTAPGAPNRLGSPPCDRWAPKPCLPIWKPQLTETEVVESAEGLTNRRYQKVTRNPEKGKSPCVFCPQLDFR